MATPISLELDEKAIGRLVKTADRFRGKKLAARMDRGTHEAAKLLVKPIKAELKSKTRKPKFNVRQSGGGSASVTSYRKTGTLRKSVKAWKFKTRRNHIIGGAGVGPTAPHRHLVLRGTNRHSLAPKRRGDFVVFRMDRDTLVRKGSDVMHPGSKPDPFVDRAARKRGAQAFARVSKEMFI